VLVRLPEFFAVTFAEFRRKASHLPWERYLTPGRPITINATSHKSRLYHTDAVAERVAGAIADRLGRESPLVGAADDDAPGPAHGEAQLIVARLVHDRCTLSVDSSGALLHQRGYRLAAGKAPLRETLAAGLILASGWDQHSPLLDPFCGAGTLPIEAALLALHLPPGRGREFAFMHWPGYDARLWRRLLKAATDLARAEAPPILGADRDAGGIEAARANAERAGVAQAVRFERRAISDLAAPPGPGWLVTNPPYGVRLAGQGDLRDLYARFGHVVRERCAGWQVALLSPDLALARHSGLRFDVGRSAHFVNGGLAVTMLRARA
jgi:putative N6-adenine-specific DNA methylase